MTKATPTVRTLPGGAPSVGIDYEILRESDDVVLDDGVTDANGRITYAVNGSPGPWRWEAVDDTTDPHTWRIGSSKSAGSGGSYSLYEVPIALRALLNGVVDGYLEELLVADTGTGPNFRVNTGAAVILGIPVVWESDETHPILAAQDATHPKACYAGITVTGLGQAEEGKAVLTDHCGTAAASPVLPDLTPFQTEASSFLPLATFTLGNAASSNPDVVTGLTDVRTFLGQRHPMVTSIVRRTNLVTPDTTSSTTDADLPTLTTTLTLASGVSYDVEAWGAVQLKVTAGHSVSIAPSINADLAAYMATDASADYEPVENAHALTGANAILGTGAAITVKMQWKVSGAGATGSALTGIFVARAIPRS